MSLINKMLLDLDQRIEGEPKKARPTSVLDGLRPAVAGPLLAKRYRYAMLGFLVVALLSTAWYVWQTTRTMGRSEMVAAVVPVKASVIRTVVKPAPVVKSDNEAITSSLPTAVLGGSNSVRPATLASVDPKGSRTLIAIDSAMEELEATKSVAKIMSRNVKPPKRYIADWPITAKPIESPPLVTHAKMEKTPVSTSKEVTEDIYREAVALQEQGRVAEAHEKYRDALAHDPRHIKARERLVDLLLQQHQWPEAQSLLYEGINAVPDHVLFGQQLARLYAEQGNNEKALTVLENSRELARSNADFLGFLAAIYQRLGRFSEAQDAYIQALELRPLEARWWTGLAIAYEAEKNWAAANDAYDRVRTSLNADPKLIDYAEQRLAALSRKQ